MSYLKWDKLVLGYSKQTPLNIPFSGEILNSGIYPILGQNGCGKSTLLKTWLGLIPPIHGGLERNDKSLEPEKSLTQGVSFVPQFHNVNKYFSISVFDFVAQGFGPDFSSKLSEKQKNKIHEHLKEWQLSGFENTSFHELSGGQKTRALVVRAFLSHPKILFLDEPLASLDSCCRDRLMEKLYLLSQKSHMCVLLVDHHLDKFQKYFTKTIRFEKNHDENISQISF